MYNALDSHTNTRGVGGKPSLKNDGERTFQRGRSANSANISKKVVTRSHTSPIQQQ